MVNHHLTPIHERAQWLITVQTNAHGYSTGMPFMRKLCEKAFLQYYDISKTTWRRRRNQARESCEAVKSMRQRRGNSTTHSVCPWLQLYAESSGDFMPDVNELHLCDYKWKFVYQRFKADQEACGLTQHPTYGRWMDIRSKGAKHIKIRKQKRFAKCRPCIMYDIEICKATGAKRTKLVAAKARHIEWFKNERKKYYKHREKARYFYYATATLASNCYTSHPRDILHEYTFCNTNFRKSLHFTHS